MTNTFNERICLCQVDAVQDIFHYLHKRLIFDLLTNSQGPGRQSVALSTGGTVYSVPQVQNIFFQVEPDKQQGVAMVLMLIHKYICLESPLESICCFVPNEKI